MCDSQKVGSYVAGARLVTCRQQPGAAAEADAIGGAAADNEVHLGSSMAEEDTIGEQQLKRMQSGSSS